MKDIVIVGGGSAGWICAGLIAAEHGADSVEGVRVTLIESPDVGTIGVGEGTWPTMRNTLKRIGVAETDFIKNCGASFKQGSKFIGWKHGGDDFYYHPFTLPRGYGETDVHTAWRLQGGDISFADSLCVQGHLCEAGRAPKQIVTPEYACVVNYGYHLDAGKFSALLQKHCTETLGVRHILDHVTAVESAGNGDLAAIKTKASGDIKGDLFIDCSGVTSLLLGQHYQVPFVGKQHLLFNDSALAVQVPYGREQSAIASATIATAQSAGWTWDIGLSTRRGVGYVYSSAHTDDTRAEGELRAYVAQTLGGAEADKLPVRKISFRPGYREKFWHKNCVAVGMAAGFLEPLEASALAMVELSATMIRDELPTNREHMEMVSGRFNDRFRYHWDRAIDFLKLHYVLSQREDADYWRDNCRPASVPERLQGLLQLWRYQPPCQNDFAQGVEIFPSASYQYVLYGMGFDTQLRTTGRAPDAPGAALKGHNEVERERQKFLSALPVNRDLIDRIHQHGLQKI